jgi:hypothetical protein
VIAPPGALTVTINVADYWINPSDRLELSACQDVPCAQKRLLGTISGFSAYDGVKAYTSRTGIIAAQFISGGSNAYTFLGGFTATWTAVMPTPVSKIYKFLVLLFELLYMCIHT